MNDAAVNVLVRIFVWVNPGWDGWIGHAVLLCLTFPGTAARPAAGLLRLTPPPACPRFRLPAFAQHTFPRGSEAPLEPGEEHAGGGRRGGIGGQRGREHRQNTPAKAKQSGVWFERRKGVGGAGPRIRTRCR